MSASIYFPCETLDKSRITQWETPFISFTLAFSEDIRIERETIRLALKSVVCTILDRWIQVPMSTETNIGAVALKIQRELLSQLSIVVGNPMIVPDL